MICIRDIQLGGKQLQLSVGEAVTSTEALRGRQSTAEEAATRNKRENIRKERCRIERRCAEEGKKLKRRSREEETRTSTYPIR